MDKDLYDAELRDKELSEEMASHDRATAEMQRDNKIIEALHQEIQNGKQLSIQECVHFCVQAGVEEGLKDGMRICVSRVLKTMKTLDIPDETRFEIIKMLYEK